MGSGDWNDGMDRVGNKGKGESVWLGFFLYKVLVDFEPIAIFQNDLEFAATCNRTSKILQTNIEANAWDGEWYLRAWFDDGTPLGSNENDECKIDAVAQSWSVLSGAAEKSRALQSMTSVDKYLVKRNAQIIQLLDPAFNGNGLNPGYIKGYLPGIRENGGQYTHAAIWAVLAFAKLLDRDKVWELFNMINPIQHGADAASIEVYKVEPYVMAADVYANETHKGRGGWTWYTGSSGWMYQLIIQAILGIKIKGNQLVCTPCFPLTWPSITLQYRFGKALYHITIYQITTPKMSHWKMDEREGNGNAVLLLDDGAVHFLEMLVAD